MKKKKEGDEMIRSCERHLFKHLARLVLGLLTLVALRGHLTYARIVDKIAAVVNDRPITISDMERFRKKLATGGLVDDAMVKLSDPDKILKDRTALLNYLIDEHLMDSEVKRKGLEVTFERVEQEIRNMAKSNGISRDQLKAALAAKGVAMSDYQDFMKKSLERQSLIEREVSSKIRISEEDISSYYLANKGPSSTQVFEYQLAHIFFNPKGGDDKGAVSRAKYVEDKIRSGSSFEKMAEQHSEDPSFAKGGVLGTFRAGEMTKEFEQALSKIGPGEVTSVVKSAQGYHLLKILKRTIISDPKLEEERENIRRTLSADAFKRQFRLWLNQLREVAFIRINGI